MSVRSIADMCPLADQVCSWVVFSMLMFSSLSRSSSSLPLLFVLLLPQRVLWQFVSEPVMRPRLVLFACFIILSSKLSPTFSSYGR